jgi:hypothetical protein
MRFLRRLPAAKLTCGALAALTLAAIPACASASSSQFAIIEDGNVFSDPVNTLAQMRDLGAGVVRIPVFWSKIAPNTMSHTRPAGFNASDPSAYGNSFATYDAVVKQAALDGISVLFTIPGGLGGPLWADGKGAPRGYYPEWEPSAKEFGLFVKAVGSRYSGHYVPPGDVSPLPRVNLWTIWNEPNFGQDLAPQAIKGSSVSVAPGMYRNLVNAAWSSLQATGHGRDTIVIGELAARGVSGPPNRHAPEGYPGNFGQTKPLQFIRTMYCVDSSYRQFRGSTAVALGCPTTAAGSRNFRKQNPVLFQSSGFSIHPYPEWLPPTQDRSNDPDFVAFNGIPRMQGVLDRLNRIYGSGTRFSIYNDEYGYITNPPNHLHPFVSPSTAGYYLNWAEYLSWKNPRIKSYMQFLLFDPPASGTNQFASGLYFLNGTPKADRDAYRLPLYLPSTSARHGRSLELWGCVREAHFAKVDTGSAPPAQVQFQPGSQGAFQTLQTVNVTDSHGYFDLHVTFPASGTVRLAWASPNPSEGTIYSRSVSVSIH